MEFKLCSLPCRAFKQTKFLYYINSLCSGVYMVVSLCVTADMCWSGVYAGHGTDVTRTGMWTDGFRNTTGRHLREKDMSLCGLHGTWQAQNSRE
jgi:hypothetical protein